MVFHWILGESKSSQVSKTLLSIPVVLNSTSPPNSKSFSPFNNPLINYIIIIIIHSLELFTSVLADGFSLESDWQQVPQVSRTLHSILAVLNNAVVWMVSTRPPTSKSSSPFSNPLVTVPNASITIGIIVNFMFHRFSIP